MVGGRHRYNIRRSRGNGMAIAVLVAGVFRVAVSTPAAADCVDETCILVYVFSPPGASRPAGVFAAAAFSLKFPL